MQIGGLYVDTEDQGASIQSHTDARHGAVYADRACRPVGDGGVVVLDAGAHAHSTEEVLATRELRSAIVDLFSVVQDAETGQRGYLLTGENRYLAPYEAAAKSVGSSLKADRCERLDRQD